MISGHDLACMEEYFCNGHTEIRDFLSMTNTLHLQIRIGMTSTPHFAFRFHATTDATHSKLAVHFASARSGYMTSPGYKPVGGYRHCVNDWFRLDVPEGHALMISFADYVRNWWELPRMSCRGDFVELFGEEEEEGEEGGGGGGGGGGDDHGARRSLWKGCTFQQVYGSGPLVFNASLWVHLETNSLRESRHLRGTKMLFSVLPDSAVPRLVLGSGGYRLVS